MTIQLRPYQRQLLDCIRQQMRSHKRIVAVMPTGAGKGQTIGAIVSSALAKGSTVLVLAHRRRLVSQLRATIQQWGISLDDPHLIVESVQTVIRRMNDMPTPNLIIIDEAHHLVEGNMWGRVISCWPDAYVLGKTATPQRLDGRGLGEGHGGYFQSIVMGPSAQWLTDNGYLAKARIYLPPTTIDREQLKAVRGDFEQRGMSEQLCKRNICGDAIQHYKRLVFPGTALTACVSVEHAEMMAAAYEEHGISARAITESCKPQDQERIFDELAKGIIKVVTFCEMLSEGVDVPSVSAIQMLRPTQSLTMYLQQVGRALRIKPDGSHAIILDHVGNVECHGLPSEDREWSLEGRGKRKMDKALSVKTCKRCYAANATNARFCVDCGAPFEIEAREIKEIEGELQEADAARIAVMRAKRREQSSARDLGALRELAQQRGYKRGWAERVYQARLAKRHGI